MKRWKLRGPCDSSLLYNTRMLARILWLGQGGWHRHPNAWHGHSTGWFGLCNSRCVRILLECCVRACCIDLAMCGWQRSHGVHSISGVSSITSGMDTSRSWPSWCKQNSRNAQPMQLHKTWHGYTKQEGWDRLSTEPSSAVQMLGC